MNWRDYPYRFGPPVEERSLSDQFAELMNIKRQLADEELLIKAKLDAAKPKEEKKEEKKSKMDPVLFYILLGLSSPIIGVIFSITLIKLFILAVEIVKGIK